MPVKVIALISSMFVLSSLLTFAGGIRVKNAVIDEINLQKKYAYVSFDLSWENSWRSDLPGTGHVDPFNHDAAWVFVKYKDQAGYFRHALLSSISRSHVSDGKAAISASPDGKGVFIYSGSNFSGRAEYRGIRLKWNFGSENAEIKKSTEIRVLAVEMVYVPEGSFYAGDGASYGSLYGKTQDVPSLIGEGESLVRASRNSFDDEALIQEGFWISGKSGIRSKDGSFENPEYPCGYGAFYIMKYEISQGEYSGFLNLISVKQSYRREAKAYGEYRNTIRFDGNKFIAERPSRACNFLSWMDGAAYADWTGLRPMSELEFEKAARGFNSGAGLPNAAKKNEFAWNDDSISPALSIGGKEDGSEVAEGNAAFGNVTYKGGDGMSGPLRCGIFENPGQGKLSGRSYYGVLDLSGNLAEQCVTIGNQAGRSFTGNEGDGMLNEAGDADVSYWPGINGNSDQEKSSLAYVGNVVEGPGVTAAAGSGQKGGSWYTKKSFLMISDRSYASHPLDYRSESAGFRCVRSAR